MRSTTTAAAGTLALLGVTALAPAAHAATKFEFENVRLGAMTGTIYASTKIHNKKPDLVYCEYASTDYAFLGYYEAFLEEPPTDADGVLTFCQTHFEERQQ